MSASSLVFTERERAQQPESCISQQSCIVTYNKRLPLFQHTTVFPKQNKQMAAGE